MPWSARESTSPASVHPTRRRETRALIASAAATVALALLAVPYLFAAMFSVMMFDAPGSTSNPWIWLAFLAVCAYPLLIVAAVVSAWVFLGRQRYTAAFRAAITGIVLVVVPAALFLSAVVVG